MSELLAVIAGVVAVVLCIGISILILIIPIVAVQYLVLVTLATWAGKALKVLTRAD